MKTHAKYNGPSKYRPKFVKGTKKEIALYLKQHREQYPQYYVMPGEKTCNHEFTMLVRGNWGPHSAKKQCVDCGKWLKWVSAAK